VKAVEELVSKVSTDYVTYGLKEVEEAVDFGAVDKLLVIDSFLFENKDAQRIIEKAEKMRSKVMIISHENEISDKLKGLTGIAAILRFKVS
jgi:protein pelota